MSQLQMKSQAEAGMADDLQASIDEALEAAEAAAAKVGAASEAIVNDAPVRASKTATAPETATKSPTDDLSAQIDSLLDEAQIPSDPPPISDDAAAASAAPSQSAVPIDEAQAVEQSVDDEPPPCADTAKLAAVDDLLAQHAGQVMAEELDEPTSAPATATQSASVGSSPAAQDEEAEPDAHADDAHSAEADDAIAPSPRLRVHVHGPRALCALLNRPLAHATPQTRMLVGVIGLMTCFNAAALFLYALLGG